MSSYCPPGALSGIVQLAGQLTQPQIQNIQLNASPPIQFNIAPRSTAALFKSDTSRNIDDTANNFIFFKNKKYSIIDVQVCKIQHTGYKLPDMVVSDSQAELIITCYNDINTPEGILLCLPIHQVANESVNNATYIKAALKISIPDSGNKYPTLDTMFTGQPSFSYQTCFQVQLSDKSIMAHSLQIFVFPKGIQINAQDMGTLKPHLANKYNVPKGMLNNLPIVTSSTYDNNKMTVSATSPSEMYTMQLQVISNEFNNMFVFYLQDISSVTKKKSDPLYKTSQYKCMPFDPTKNLVENNGAIYVTPGQTNPTIADMVKEQAGGTTDTNMREDIITYTILGIGGIGTCVCLYFAYKVATK
jgi:hypothetical protein